MPTTYKTRGDRFQIKFTKGNDGNHRASVICGITAIAGVPYNVDIAHGVGKTEADAQYAVEQNITAYLKDRDK